MDQMEKENVIAGYHTLINWDKTKYEDYYYPAIWKTQKTKKFIGLDHQTPLGKNGISLNDFYANYASTEGSNIDGGKTGNGTIIEVSSSAATDPVTDPVTDKPTDTTQGKAAKYGDANNDGSVDMSDVVMVMQACLNPQKYGVEGSSDDRMTPDGEKNADVDGKSGVTPNDALVIQKFTLSLVDSLPIK